MRDESTVPGPILPRVVVKPVAEQRFTTLGDWWEDESGQFTISISRMTNWKHEFLVLVHELTEWAICQADGVPTEACDRFDEMWEEELKRGVQKIETEAGFDYRCPYRRGHVWGTRLERLFAWLLRVRWKEYCRTCNEVLIENRSRAERAAV